MSSIKVSALTAKTSPSGSEELLINDSGTSKKITIANLTKGHDLPAVPTGIADDTNKEYNLKLTDVSGTETLTWVEETDNDTTYSTVTTSADGLAPTLPATHSDKFLRGDATWVVPTDTDTTYSNFSGTTAGLVPTSTVSDDTKFLRADGTWVVPTDTDTNTNQLTTFTVSATTDTNATTISQGDDLMFTAGTGITCETTADGTVTITNTVTDTDTVYTHPNHSGEVTSTGDGATVVADNVVDEANLKVSNAPTNGQFLSAQSAASGGLTWAAVDALPSQSGNAGKYLTTDATNASWATLDTDANTTTKGLYEHAHTINTAYSITSTNNAMSAGPVVIGSSGSVTVPATSVWTIV